MPLFLIERQFAELVPTDPETAATVKQVNDEIGIQWLFSFLSADKRKTSCLYEAPSAAAIRAAAERLGIPADTIVEVDGIGLTRLPWPRFVPVSDSWRSARGPTITYGGEAFAPSWCRLRHDGEKNRS